MGSILCFILELSFVRERVVYLTLPKKNTLGTKSSLETTEASARESCAHKYVCGNAEIFALSPSRAVPSCGPFRSL